MEFAYHNAYVFQGLVPSIVIFWSAQLRTQNLHKEGCIALRWESSIQKRHSHHHEVVYRYYASMSQMTMYLFLLYRDVFFPVSPTILLQDLNVSNTANVL